MLDCPNLDSGAIKRTTIYPLMSPAQCSQRAMLSKAARSERMAVCDAPRMDLYQWLSNYSASERPSAPPATPGLRYRVLASDIPIAWGPFGGRRMPVAAEPLLWTRQL